MGKMKILAIDDNVVNLATIEQELKSEYEVIPVNSGRRALKLIYQEKVDLILLDIQMPVMDGIETLKQIREHENGITVPVIMLTAKHDRATVIEGTKLGIMDYIVKPFDGEDLRRRIESALKRRGALPMEEKELYQRLEDIVNCVKNGNNKLAYNKTDEALNYQLDTDITKRLQAVRAKMKDGEYETAQRMVERILQMIDQKNMESSESKLLPISLGELNTKLLQIMDDVEHFKVEEADDKFEDLMRYALPIKIKDKCLDAQKCNKDYDDGEAERILREILKDL